jgi:hypothetical protein
MKIKSRARPVGPPVPQMSTGGFAIFPRNPAPKARHAPHILISDTSLGNHSLLR